MRCFGRLTYLVTLIVVLSIPGCGRTPVNETIPSSDEATATESSLDESETPAAIDESVIAAAPVDNRFHALLVGCTKYDYLDEAASLRGPINDVHMMQNLLTTRFKFPANQIVTLTEGRNSAERPTKANIVDSLKRLSERVNEGDYVVVLLSGHGSQQPDDDPENPEDLEPDGLDEIFCPADMKDEIEVVDDIARIPNALSDDELGSLLTGIRDAGASVWVIVDACHSGSAVRGTEVYRQLPAERFFSADLLQRAKSAAGTNTRSLGQESESFDVADQQGGLVAIYAAQPHEQTIELPLPKNDETAEWRGLLTYTMATVLAGSTDDLTYHELVQRIHAEYIQTFGRLGPTPLIEGEDQHHQILGDHENRGRSQIVLNGGGPIRWTVNGGKVQGVTEDSVFAVYPPAGSTEDEQVLGYVKVTQARLLSATAISVAHEDMPQTNDLPLGGRCVPVELKGGTLQLQVAFDLENPTDLDEDALTNSLMSAQSARVSIVDETDAADWLIQSHSGRIYLVPAAGWTGRGTTTQSYFGPAPQDSDPSEWLLDRLTRIARVHSLLKLSSATASSQRSLIDELLSSKACDIETTLVRIDEENRSTESVEWTRQGRQLTDGDIVALQVENSGDESIDFSVLFIDSRFGIDSLFPSPGTVADNRLEPGATHTVGPMRVERDSLGLEHLVVIATRAVGQPMDFSWLSQESLEQAELTGATRSGLTMGTEHPLSRMFQEALFSGGNVRGMRMTDVDDVSLKVLTWETIANDAEPE